MAKFEIPKEKTKGKPRHTKAPATEQQSETCEDEKQQKYLDLEQEVKEAESRTKHKECSRRGDRHRCGSSEARGWSKRSWREGQQLTRRQHKRQQPLMKASNKDKQQHRKELQHRKQGRQQQTRRQHKRQQQMMKASNKNTQQHWKELQHRKHKKEMEKDERVRALVQERKTTEKHNKDRIREISKEIKKCIRDNKRTKRQEKRQKKSGKVKDTKNISSIKSVKKRILIPKVKNKEGEAVKTRQGIANVFAKIYEDLYKGEEAYNDEDMSWCTDHENADFQPNRHNSGVHNRRDPSGHRSIETRKSERQQWNTSGTTQNLQWWHGRKDKDHLQRNCAAGRLHTKKLAKDPYSKSSTKRVTERILAITGQFVNYLFYTSCLRQFCMPDLLPLCTKYSLLTRLVSGLIIDVRITLRCTEFWSNDVVSGVYHCSSAQSTSQKLLTVSNIQRYGNLCDSTGLNQHTWNCYNGCTNIKKVQSWQTKKVMCSRSEKEPNKAIRCHLFCSTRCCSIRWKTIWQSGKRTKKASGWVTKKKTAWQTRDSQTMCSYSPRRWGNCAICCATSRTALYATEAVGLGIHRGKTKILNNQDNVKAKEITVDNLQIEILKKGQSARYLRQKITFEDHETEEIKNRLKAAWAAFHKYRQELTSRDYRSVS